MDNALDQLIYYLEFGEFETWLWNKNNINNNK